MKVKQKLKRILALILVMTTVLSFMPTEYICAENNDIITETISDMTRPREREGYIL